MLKVEIEHGVRAAAIAALALLCLFAGLHAPAWAVTVELKDVASDRIERQRAAAEGSLPLPGTPDVSAFEQRLSDKGLKLGAPLFIRAFKAESELEVWMVKDGRYVLFANYPVCQWSGSLGPKVRESDRQTPEGFYTVTRRQLHRSGRHPKSLNLGFPNAFDKSLARTGSYILVHGGCSSVGCFAMTDTIIDEIWQITEAALKEGQEHIPVHVFPFRMTDQNMTRFQDTEWKDFWSNLKEGYDAFERTRYPPRVTTCDKKYGFQDITPSEVGDPGPLAVCGETLAAIQTWEQSGSLASAQLPFSSRQPSTPRQQLIQRASRLQASLVTIASSQDGGFPLSSRPAFQPTSTSIATQCSSTLASCRKYVALQHQRVQKQMIAAARSKGRRLAGRP